MLKLDKSRIYLHAPDAAIIAAATISPAPSPDELEEACLRAAARHGSVHMKVSRRSEGDIFLEECGAPNIPVNHLPLESEYDWFGVVEEERSLPLDIENGEMLRFTLLENSDCVQLIAAMHRIAGDERSMLLLLNDISRALNDRNARFDNLPMENIDPAELVNGKLSGMPSVMLGMCNKRWRQQGRGFGEPEYAKLFAAAKDKISGAVVYCRDISPEITAKLKKLCAAKNTSLTAAVIAALAIAWNEVGDVGVTLNIRPDGNMSLGDYSTSAAIAVDPRGLEFWDSAKQISGTLHSAETDPSKREFMMKFLSAAEPTLIDAVWYLTYGLIRHPMVSQMSEMLCFGSNARGVSIVNAGTASFAAGKYSLGELWLLPPNIPNALRNVAVVEADGRLYITMQCADDENADTNGERFEDAMSLLEEASVE